MVLWLYIYIFFLISDLQWYTRKYLQIKWNDGCDLLGVILQVKEKVDGGIGAMRLAMSWNWGMEYMRVYYFVYVCLNISIKV